jgi:hypothetical protein
MDNTTLLVILALLVLAVVGAALFLRRRRSETLRQRFGPEYAHTVERLGDQGRAEAELEARQKRVAKLDIRPLPEPERRRFAESWRDVQARFVDNPGESIRQADRLVKEVMQAKGYPMGDFEQRMADVSVEHPQVVENYRSARAIAQANERGQASTENLRQAMVHYRALFAELLVHGMEPGPAPTPPAAEPVRAEQEPAGAPRR